ncbi:hypothetical protein EVA_14969 [gut metagenome]|uniref:Uncharacterized protein n=1 Tax=gut metagenome TaxID=749906 RepID=J9FQZ9_9ZZZZ
MDETVINHNLRRVDTCPYFVCIVDKSFFRFRICHSSEWN